MLQVGDVVKPMKEATHEERNALEERHKKMCEKHLGLKYIGKKVS